ncbi:putative T7SS-secreted protein [Microbacterium sp.]|uniref:putative T7SS-secreted protein n=1 Tax=Microbacterium sp. TaxID=51671 RepID=UPI002FE351F1
MQTSKGRDVEVVPGDAVAIADRGSKIKELGDSMVSAAATLKDIKDGSIDGEGYAMDKIKDVVGDVHKDLDEAGRRYKPAGTTLSNYATALETAQSRMRTIVSDCQTSLTELQTAQSNAADAADALQAHNNSTRLNPPEPEDASANTTAGTNLANAASGAASSLTTAETTHNDNLDAFDGEYDTWHTAYETAVSGLSDANEIGEDSRWENIAGVLAVIAEWVSWIGLAIAVLGLIIGGPFFAIAALVVGVIALALTVALMFDGRKGWGDLAMSIIGILPIGKLGQGFGKFFKAIPKQLTGPLGQIRNIRNISALPKGGWKAASKVNFADFVTKVSKTRMTGPFSLAGLGQRFLGGANRSFTVAFQDAAAAGTGYGNRLINQLPDALQSLAKSPAPDLFEQAYNVYKWADKGVALAGGSPSGGLSPAGMVNGLTR